MNDIAANVISAKKTPWGILCEMSDGTSYHATSNDPSEEGKRAYDLLASGAVCKVAEMTEEDVAEYRAQENMAAIQGLISSADTIIRRLSDERDAGIISDDDLNLWKAWVAYRKALRELDVTDGEIEWPDKPE